MLIDSDVLIWMMRGHVGAATRLKAILPWRISVVTYIELAQGCRNKLELTQANKGLAMCQTAILPINESISNRAITLIDQYSLSHGLLLADALIDATAQGHGLTLFTANVKHFGAIENLAVEAFVP